jgi:uncharacterized protein YukE
VTGGGGSAFGQPAGDPGELYRLADQLAGAAGKVGDLSASTRQVTGRIRYQADWTGDAADAYTAFTTGAASGIGRAEAPLGQIAGAVRDYAASLEAAQQRVRSAAHAAELAAATGNPGAAAVISAAGQGAADARAQLQSAASSVAARIRSAGDELGRIWGPDGAVRNWIERAVNPKDLTLADLVFWKFARDARFYQEFGERANLLKVGDQWWQDIVRPIAMDDQAGRADILAGMDRWLRTSITLDRYAGSAETVSGAMGTLARGGAVATGALALAADGYTMIKPEDPGAMGWVDRTAAGANAGLTTVDMLAALDMTTVEIPVVGEAALVGTGVYLAGDYLYHHWTGFHNVANDVGHGVATAAKSTVAAAKSTWHAVTSIF